MFREVSPLSTGYDAARRVEESSIAGVFDGPRVLVHDGEQTRWRVTPARAAAEIEGRARLSAHPFAAAVVARENDDLVFPRLHPLADPDEALDGITELAHEIVPSELSVRDVLHAFAGPVNAGRALGRAGLSRSDVDRFLARAIVVQTPRGIDLGGVMPAGIFAVGEAQTALSVRFGRADGWPVLDLASLALRGGLDGAGAHVAMGGSDNVFDLAVVHQALRELVVERDESRRVALRDRVSTIVTQAVRRAPRKERCVFAFEPRRDRRRRLFSRWFEGIQVDDEGLYSATPEALADRIAAGLSGVVVDATCGVGAIAIALARSPSVTRVVAIDRDATRLRMAAHNAGVYGVADRIDFRVGDALEIVPTLRFDALVIDPPWGGRDYDRARVTQAELGMPIAPLLDLPRVVLKLPRSFDVATLPTTFVVEALRDDRGVLKMLVARRGIPA